MSIVRKDPKTGRFYTVEGSAPIDLNKARRETRARIDGTEQFHVDPFAKPVEPVPVETEVDCFCAILGGECEACS